MQKVLKSERFDEKSCTFNFKTKLKNKQLIGLLKYRYLFGKCRHFLTKKLVKEWKY